MKAFDHYDIVGGIDGGTESRAGLWDIGYLRISPHINLIGSFNTAYNYTRLILHFIIKQEYRTISLFFLNIMISISRL